MRGKQENGPRPDLSRGGPASSVPICDSPSFYGRRRDHLVVLLFVGALFGFGVRSLVTADSRFGWGMFSRNLAYMIEYAWVYEDGSRTRHVPGDELQGKATQLAPRRGQSVFHHGDRRSRNTRYGLGTVRSWIRSYLAYLYQDEERRPAEAVAIEARLHYAINQRRRDRAQPLVEVIGWGDSSGGAAGR